MGRKTRIYERIGALPHVDRLRDIFDGIPRGSSLPSMESLALRAEARGVPNYRCEGYIRYVELNENPLNDDLDPSLTRSTADDLANMCRVAQEIANEVECAPAQRINYAWRSWEMELNNPELWDWLRNQTRLPPDERYDDLVRFANNHVPGWTCEAIKEFYESD